MLSSFHSIQPLHVHGVTAEDVASVEGREDIAEYRKTGYGKSRIRIIGASPG